ncbi:MAG: glucosyltransferase domain-containing protein [Clostridia bacterium]|nr:glucosyltransferase domain-containing protein [Clostridia bacterium]
MRQERSFRWGDLHPRKAPQMWAALLGALLFGLFAHGTGLFNKLSHQDDIANLFGFGATITSGRWMLHLLSWLEGLFFGTGNTSLPLYNGIVSILCVGAVCAILTDLLKIRNPVYCALLGCLLVAFPTMAALFSYMFTSHPYMIGLLMAVLAAWLICRETPWWAKAVAAGLGGASVGVYQAFLPVLLSVILIYDFMTLEADEKNGALLKRVGIQILCVAGVMAVYFAANRFFLWKFNLQLSSYQGIDRMGVMSLSTFLDRCAKAYALFFRPPRNVAEDMYPGSLYTVHGIVLAANILLALFRIVRTGRRSGLKAVLLTLLLALFPLGSNMIYVMSEEVHGLMVFGGAMPFVLLIAQLDDLETRPFRGRRAVSLLAALGLAATGLMYARFDHQCYLKDTLQQSEAMSYYTTVITRIKSAPGYTPETEICFVNDWSNLDPTIYDLPEMDFIQLNLYGHNTTEYIHLFKEFFMRAWCGFEGNWYWGEDPAAWPEVQAMPSYPADGSVQMIRDILVIKF